MAIGWVSLLKTVPWADVLATAPAVAEGAKKLWNSVAPKLPARSVPAPAGADSSAALLARIAALEASNAELHAQMRASSELIQALANQNTELVQRAEAHRVRLLWTSVCVAGLGVLVLLSFFIPH